MVRQMPVVEAHDDAMHQFCLQIFGCRRDTPAALLDWSHNGLF